MESFLFVAVLVSTVYSLQSNSFFSTGLFSWQFSHCAHLSQFAKGIFWSGLLFAFISRWRVEAEEQHWCCQRKTEYCVRTGSQVGPAAVRGKNRAPASALPHLGRSKPPSSSHLGQHCYPAEASVTHLVLQHCCMSEMGNCALARLTVSDFLKQETGL